TSRVHAAAHVIDGSTRRDVALHDWSPATDFHQAFLSAVTLRECSLFVITGTYAMAMDRFVEQPLWPPKLIELRQRPQSLQKEQRAGNCLGEIVADRGATGDVDHRQPVGAAIIFTQEIHYTHGTGGVPDGGGNSAPSRTGANRDHGSRVRREPLQP